MNRIEVIQSITGDTTQLLQIPNKIAKKIIQFLQNNQYEVMEVYENDKNISDLMKAKNFLRRATPFMIAAFTSYLKEECNCKEILKELSHLKKKKESKQHKYELSDLRYLLKQEKGETRPFLLIFEKFLQSNYLWRYILNNKKIKTDQNKLLYWKCRELFLKEIKKDNQIFLKFISNKNAQKVVQYLQDINEKKDSLNNSIFEPEPLQNVSDYDTPQDEQFYEESSDSKMDHFFSSNILFSEYSNENGSRTRILG